MNDRRGRLIGLAQKGPRTRLTCTTLILAFSLSSACSRERNMVADYREPPEADKAWIIATPNPVPARLGRATTVVNWYAGKGRTPEVYLSVVGGPERFFSDLSSHQEADIGPGVHEFRLYERGNRTKLLAMVQVRRLAH